MPKLERHQRRIGSYGQKADVADQVMNKKGVDLDKQRKGVASRQQPTYY